jgi:hypothetical protein
MKQFPAILSFHTWLEEIGKGTECLSCEFPRAKKESLAF